MHRSRPAKVTRDALTQWNIRSRFGTASLQGEYRCSGFTTTTTVRMTLPRWIPPEGVSDSVKREWERYIRVLKQHEAGHGQMALAAEAELHRRVAAVGTDTDPDRLKSTVEDLVRRTLREFQERDREYDRLTRHGLEQGAALGSGDGREKGGASRRPNRPTEEGGNASQPAER
jgi:predicted secreted Zn-dependent protease